MSLSAILEAIDSAGEAQVQEIEKEAQIKVNEILAEAHSEVQEIESAARQSAMIPALQERARLMHRARLEALSIIGSVRAELVNRALDQAQGRLASLRNHPIYPDVLARLTSQALKELETSLDRVDRPVLRADPRDRPLMEAILAASPTQWSVIYNLECWGGVIAQSEDGRVVVINTLESRLERATPYLRHYLSAWFESAPVARQIVSTAKPV